jgi:aminomethyltransferase
MPIGTPFHPRTAPLNQALDWRHWSGYFAASRYHDFHQPEYAAIRNGAALIDVSPLYKYLIRGRDAVALVNRVITRDASKCRVGRVIYTPWCDEEGKILQEGTVLRLDRRELQVNATEPALTWLRMNAVGLEVEVVDRSSEVATLAVQGPCSRDLLAEVAPGLGELKFFHWGRYQVDGRSVLISRTGYTGDLGYEVWVEADDAPAVWDAIAAAGPRHGAVPCGIMAMDVARIEAGFILLDVDYVGADRALIPSQKSSPYEVGLGWAVKLKKKTPFIGREALRREKENGSPWQLRGLEIDWPTLEEIYGRVGLMPDLPLTVWRDPRPVYADGRQVGRATSGCWSTLLKKYLAIVSLETPWAEPGSTVRMEVTVDYERQAAPAKVVELPFFRPDRMRA